MAESSTGQAVKDLTTVYTSLLLDLPLASVRQGAGLAGEKETPEAVWKGYDAGVRLATAAIDTLYRSPLFGDAVSRTLNELLRWQRVTNAVSGTVLTGMWRALGVPTAVDVRGISDQLHALEARLTEKRDSQSAQYQMPSTQRSRPAR